MHTVLLYVNDQIEKEIKLGFVPFRHLNLSVEGKGYFVDKIGFNYNTKEFHCFCQLIV